MIDERPSGEYTIEDLDFLAQVVTTEHATLGRLEEAGLLEEIPAGSTGRRGDEVAHRARQAGVTLDVSGDALPRYWAERLLAGGRHEPTLRALASSRFLDVRAAVSRNEATPPDALLALTTVPFATVCQTACANPALPEAAIEDLAYATGEIGPAQRSGIATNPATPARLLAALAGDLDPWVRCTAVRNPHTPTRAVPALLDDPDDAVRIAVADRPDLTAEQARQLADDSSPYVRANIAARDLTRLPDDVADHLAGDSSPSVRARLARNRTLPAHLAQRLATDTAPQVLTELAGNPATPPALLDTLARTRHAGGAAIRHAVCANPATALSTLHRLATGDRAAHIRNYARELLRAVGELPPAQNPTIDTGK